MDSELFITKKPLELLLRALVKNELLVNYYSITTFTTF